MNNTTAWASRGRFAAQLDTVIDVQRRLAADAAAQATQIDALRVISESDPAASTLVGRGLARRVLVSELACALRIPERTAENLIETSKSLVHTLPATLTALSAGLISYRHACILVDQAILHDADDTAALEAEVLPAAERLTAPQFLRKARTTRERLNVETITARHQRSVADRAVFYEPAADGMAWLSQYLPATEAAAIYTRITTTAITLQSPNENRTLTQLRADVFRDLILDHETGSVRGIKPDVCLLVPVLSLLGHGDEPATLEGYGPIDMDTARELVGKATSFIRILTHPETGAFLSVGRTRYKAPADLKTVLRIRDATCRYPGCNRAAANCDLDHTDDWSISHGATECENLSNLCPRHHALKHETGWSVTQATDRSGTLHWVSPSGKHYTTEPEHHIGPSRTGPTPEGTSRGGPARGGPDRNCPVRNGPVRNGPVRNATVLPDGPPF